MTSQDCSKPNHDAEDLARPTLGGTGMSEDAPPPSGNTDNDDARARDFIGDLERERDAARADLAAAREQLLETRAALRDAINVLHHGAYMHGKDCRLCRAEQRGRTALGAAVPDSKEGEGRG